MTVLFPGTVTGYLPYQLLTPVEIPGPAVSTPEHILALLLGITGLAILIWSIREIAHRGRETLAPFDEPGLLVINGLYRFARNPLYVGRVLIQLSECQFFGSTTLLI